MSFAPFRAAAVLGALLFPALAAPATAQQRFDGFNLGYAPPAGWTLGERKGRIHVYTDAAQRAVLIVAAGSYSGLDVAFADIATTQSLLARHEDTPFEPPSERMVSGRRVMAAALAGTGNDGQAYVVRGFSTLTAHGTALGAAIIIPRHRDGEARRGLDALLASVADAAPVENRALAARLRGSWRRGSGYGSNSPGGGGMTSEETWTFDGAGRFTMRSTSVVSMPGVAIEPRDERSSGRWAVIGDGLVLERDGMRTTVSVAFDGAALLINDVRYLPLR